MAHGWAGPPEMREGCGSELGSSAQSTSDAARVSGIMPVLSTLPPTHQLKPWASGLTLGSLSWLIRPEADPCCTLHSFSWKNVYQRQPCVGASKKFALAPPHWRALPAAQGLQQPSPCTAPCRPCGSSGAPAASREPLPDCAAFQSPLLRSSSLLSSEFLQHLSQPPYHSSML